MKVKPVNISQLNLSIDPSETVNSRSWHKHLMNRSSFTSSVSINFEMSLESEAGNNSNNSTLQTNKDTDKETAPYHRAKTFAPNNRVSLNKSLFKRRPTKIPERESTFKDFIGSSKQSYGDSRHSEDAFYL